MQRNRVILIGVLAVLLFIKFILVPLQEKQHDLHQKLTVVTKQLQRSQALIEQKDSLQQWQDSQKQELHSLLRIFPKVSSAAQYRLELQKEFQNLAAEKSVSVTFFDWLTDTPLNALDVHRGRVLLKVEGSASDVMQLHLLLEQKFPHLSLRDIKANWRGGLNPNSRIKLNLLIDVDYRLLETA